MTRELIEALEKASGPSFALDCAIRERLLPDEWFGIKIESWFGAGTGVYGCNTVDGKRHLECLRALPVTVSIDAALTLVPKGALWGIDNDVPGSMDGPFHTAWCGSGEGGQHKHAAIALCIAALRAEKNDD